MPNLGFSDLLLLLVGGGFFYYGVFRFWRGFVKGYRRGGGPKGRSEHGRQRDQQS